MGFLLRASLQRGLLEVLTSLACSQSLCRARGSQLYNRLPAGTSDNSTESSEAAVEHQIDLAILAVGLHAHGLCWLLAVPGLVTFGGLVPPVSTVSHGRYVAAGVPVHPLVVALRGSMPDRCWIYASLGACPHRA